MKRLSFYFSLAVMTFVCSGAAIAQPASAAGLRDLRQFSLADTVERVMPSVVNISTTRVNTMQSPMGGDPFFRDFFHFFGPQMPQARPEQSLGSGVIVSDDGLVITNNHVVERSEKIRVTLGDKREFEAKLVGTDPKSDLAVLRLKNAKGLKPLTFGDSDKLRLGDIVLAVGNPFNIGQTVTMGIVSAKGRANMGIVDYEDFIQTDAAINPGNSGGAMINANGELVGINTAILSRTGGYQGIGFAIPTNMVKPIMGSLIKYGKVSRGWLGVIIQDVSPDLAQALKLPQSNGVLISDIDQSGPAAKVGLKRGDLVTKINGHAVDSSAKLRSLVGASGAGKKISLEYIRDGKAQSVEVVLGELPGKPGDKQDQAEEDLGLSVAPLTPQYRNKYNIPSRLNYGVLVENVRPGSPAENAGIQAGDVILEVNRVKINSVNRFPQTIKEAGKRALLLVYRRGNTIFMILNR